MLMVEKEKGLKSVIFCLKKPEKNKLNQKKIIITKQNSMKYETK